MEATKNVGAQVFFELYSEGKLATQAAVEPLGPMKSVDLFVDENLAEKRRTGIAIANLSATGPVVVNLTLYDANGTFVNSRMETLGPLAHRASFVDELFAGLNQAKGTLRVISSTTVTLTSLQQTELIIGTLPPIRRTPSVRLGDTP